jgi:hypothetical protein
MIGVEIMLSTFWICGRARVSPETLAALTQDGVRLFKPEYDLHLYITGCMLTCCIFIGLEWLQRRLPPCGQTTPVTSSVDQQDGSVQRRWSRIVLCVILFSLHLCQLIVIRKLFTGDEGAITPLASATLFVVPLLSSCMVIFGWHLPHFKCPLWVESKPKTALLSPHGILHRWPDLVIPLLVIAVTYIPGHSNLAQRIFIQDFFHHWDFYAMGPTLAFHHGRALGTDFYTQYGVGWPLLYHTLAQFAPISYGKMIQVAVIYGCIYFIGVYVLLVLLLKSRVWAAVGLCLAITLQLFSGVGAGTLWTYPSSTILRSPLDVWFFICILLHVRSTHGNWLRLAAALAGAAIAFGTDTGIYLSATFAAYLLYVQSLPRTYETSIRRQIQLALQAATITLSVFLPMLWIAGRGTLLQRDFWAGWLESLIAFGGGFGALPIASVDPLGLLLFALALVLYLSMIGATLVALPRRDNTPDDVVLACLGTYGLATLLLFVGRSHPYNLFHVSIPFSIIAVATLVRWSNSWRPPKYLPTTECAGKPTVPPLNHLLPWGALAVTTMLMLTNRSFLRYPGMAQTLLLGPPPAELRLSKELMSACDMPANTQKTVSMFDAVIGRMKEAVASGATVAVLDGSDTIFYLASNIAPWPRYSPIFPALYTRTAVARFVREVAERGPEVVVICANPAHGGSYDCPDVWRAAHEAIATHYRLDSTEGIFEFWRRDGVRAISGSSSDPKFSPPIKPISANQ